MTYGYPPGPMSGRGGPFNEGCQCAFCWCSYGPCQCEVEVCEVCGCCGKHCTCYEDDPVQLVAALLQIDEAYSVSRQARCVLFEMPIGSAGRSQAEQNDQRSWIAWCKVRDQHSHVFASDAATQVERIADLEQVLADWVKTSAGAPQVALFLAWLAQELAQIAFRVHRAAWILDGLRTDGDIGLRAQRAAEEVTQSAHEVIQVVRETCASHAQVGLVCDESIQPPSLPLLATDREDWYCSPSCGVALDRHSRRWCPWCGMSFCPACFSVHFPCR